MNKTLIDKHLLLLSSILPEFNNDTCGNFEPTEEIYQKLQSGEENHLQEVVLRIANYINLPYTPSVSYEWGLTMGLDTAGQLKYGGNLNKIQIPFFYLARHYALGAILAHELTHILLFSRNIILSDTNENEMLTDVATVHLGLGKLILNGCIVEIDEFGMELNVLGYLSPESILYIYKQLNTDRNVSIDTAINNLRPSVIQKLNTPDTESNGKS